MTAAPTDINSLIAQRRAALSAGGVDALIAQRRAALAAAQRPPVGTAFGVPGNPGQTFAAPPGMPVLPDRPNESPGIWSDIDRGLNQVYADTRRQLGGAMATAGGMLPGELGRTLSAAGNEEIGLAATIPAGPEPTGFAGQAARTIGGMSLPVAAGLVNGPLGFAVGAGVQSGGGQYADVMDRLGPGAERAATTEGAAMGAFSAGTSYVLPALALFGRAVPQAVQRAASRLSSVPAVQAAMRYLTTGAAEGTQETLEEGGSMLLQQIAEDDPAAWNGWGRRVALAFGLGALGGTVAQGATDVARRSIAAGSRGTLAAQTTRPQSPAPVPAGPAPTTQEIPRTSRPAGEAVSVASENGTPLVRLPPDVAAMVAESEGRLRGAPVEQPDPAALMAQLGLTGPAPTPPQAPAATPQTLTDLLGAPAVDPRRDAVARLLAAQDRFRAEMEALAQAQPAQRPQAVQSDAPPGPTPPAQGYTSAADIASESQAPAPPAASPTPPAVASSVASDTSPALGSSRASEEGTPRFKVSARVDRKGQWVVDAVRSDDDTQRGSDLYPKVMVFRRAGEWVAEDDKGTPVARTDSLGNARKAASEWVQKAIDRDFPPPAPDLTSLTVPQLREEAARLGIDSKGGKKALVDRLTAQRAAPPAAGTSPPTNASESAPKTEIEAPQRSTLDVAPESRQPSDLSSLTVPQLRAEAARRGLPTTGGAKVLRDRLQASPRPTSEEGTGTPPSSAEPRTPESRSPAQSESQAAPPGGQSPRSVPTPSTAEASGSSEDATPAAREPSEERLSEVGLLRKFGDRWQYKTSPEGRWYFSNTQEGAAEQARAAYLRTPPEQRLTASQRFDKANADNFASMDATYGRMSLDELKSLLDEAGGVRGLPVEREFTGTGTRRSGVAMANQGARDAGEFALKMRVYLKERVEKALREGRPVPARVLADYPDLAPKAAPNSPATPDSSRVGQSAQDTPRWGIYRVSVKDGGERFAVRQSDDPRGFGDTLHDTLDAALEYSKSEQKREAANAEYRKKEEAARAERDAKDAKARTERDDTDGFADTLSPMQRGKVIASLNKLVRIDNRTATIKQVVRSMVKAGDVQLTTREEPKIKPMSRAAFNRAGQREQDAHEKRMKEAGTKTVYRVNGYDLGKTGYDYAKHLSSATTPDSSPAPPQSPGSPAAEPAQGTIFAKLDAIEAKAKDRIKKRTIPRGRGTGAETLIADSLDAAVIVAVRALKVGIKGGRALTKLVAEVRAEFPKIASADPARIRRVAVAIIKQAKGDLANIETAIRDVRGVAAAPRPTQVKATVRAATGLTPDEKTVTEPEALRAGLSKAAKAAKGAFREGAREARAAALAEMQAKIDALKDRQEFNAAIRSEVVDFVKEYAPTAEQGAFLTAASNSKNTADLARVMDRVARHVVRSDARALGRLAARLASWKSTGRFLYPDERRQMRQHAAVAAGYLQQVRAKDQTTAQLDDAKNALQRVVDEMRAIRQEAMIRRAENAAHKRNMRETLAEAAVRELRDGAKPMKRADGTTEAPDMTMGMRVRRGFSDLQGSLAYLTGRANSILERRLYNDMTDAESAHHAQHRDDLAELGDIAKKTGSKSLAEMMRTWTDTLGKGQTETVKVRAGGKDWDVSLTDWLDLVMIDSQTRPKLFKAGFNWTGDQDGPVVRISRREWLKARADFEARFPGFIGKVKGLIGRRFKPAAEVAYRLNGWYPRVVGSDYWRRRRNNRKSEDAGLPRGVRDIPRRFLENLGLLQERTEDAKTPFLVGQGLEGVIEHLDNVSKLTHLAEPTRAATAILYHPDVRGEVSKRIGGLGWKMLETHLAESSLTNESGGAGDFWARVVRDLNRNRAVAALATSVRSMLRNLGGTFRAMNFMEPAVLLDGLTHLRGVSLRELSAKSGYFWHRYHAGGFSRFSPVISEIGTVDDASIGDALRGIAKNIKAVGNVGPKNAVVGAYINWQQLGQYFMRIYNAVDGVISRAVYMGFRRQAAKLHPDWSAAKLDDWAVTRAERVIRQSQNPSSAADMTHTALAVRRSGAGLFTLFTSDNQKANTAIRRQWSIGGKRAGSRAVLLELLNRAWGYGAVAALDLGLIAMIRAALAGDEDELDKELEKYAKRAPRDFARMTVETAVPIGGIYAMNAVDVLTGGSNGRIFETPVADSLENGTRAAAALYRHMTDEKYRPKVSAAEQAWRFTVAAGEVAGDPTVGIRRMVRQMIPSE